MLKVIRNLLLKVLDDIDNDNSNLSEEECEKIIEHLLQLTDKNKKLSKYQACKYLGISRATFDNYVREGKLPAGRKQQGFKELFYYESDLRKFKDQD